ncbi:phosphoadenosine phosphosulfate reductase [Erwinia psidii]|uniref:DUF3440 domain-containing protein n=1 Tax=Erwinia psidii TaxID=69224 RepID=A0A3N6RX49_9GAMM|nr:DUF3440 domain-containing protein [Erwinia psidii]MCX8956902.1 DUF3440 domain-containing protein [Erwinia psidii]MCX8960287.1 DUF3440 domain-containing protein [Erwinia psidii]MCX8964533.1 DUF3440 domain-containing protein [Erwinia psidii]RQM36937.1 DUF3440 domain-containing protein [Erwinia psidii]
MEKITLGKSVLTAAQDRIFWVFETFDKVCLSFSGGKDSTVMLHLAAEGARKQNRKFSVLFVDWEVQFSHTITHVTQMKELYSDVIETFFWVALPLTTTNGTSQYQPFWTCWDKEAEWVRSPPSDAITDKNFFPFYYYGIDFEEFIPEFGKWFAGNRSTAILVGIRAEESLNRYRSIISGRKMRYMDDKPWTTASESGFSYYIYPLYDWRIKDIWLYCAKEQRPMNPIYELMHKAGIPPYKMRICEPYGSEQRKSLWLFQILDPDIWNKASQRVKGANSGALYGRSCSLFYGQKNLSKPDNLSWQKYVSFLLKTSPHQTAEHYKNKIFIYLSWHQQRNYPNNIPEEQDNDLGAKDIPSWRRICKCIMKNDYWCRILSFSPTKMSSYERYCKRIQSRRKQWKLL